MKDQPYVSVLSDREFSRILPITGRHLLLTASYSHYASSSARAVPTHYWERIGVSKFYKQDNRGTLGLARRPELTTSPNKGRESPLPPLLRTVRDTFASYGSSISQPDYRAAVGKE